MQADTAPSPVGDAPQAPAEEPERDSESRLPGRRGRGFWLVVAALAVVLQAALFWIEWRPRPRPLWGDEATYWAAAAEVRAGRPADLQLIWPPLYPHWLAFWTGFWTDVGETGIGGGGRLAAQLAQVALLALAALLLRGLATAAVGAGLAADVAAALLLLDPQIAAFTVYLWPELLHLVLFLFTWWVVATRGDRPPGRRQTAWLLAAGASLGLALLTKSLLVPFIPVLLAPLAFRGSLRQRMAKPALVFAAAGIVVLPTLLENRARYGVASIADSSLFNAWVGLNDSARRNFVDEIVGDELGVYLRSSPDARVREALVRDRIGRLLEERGLGPVLRAQLGRQYFRLFHRDSFFTEQLPGGGITASGFGYAGPPAWLAATLRTWSVAVYAAVLVGAALAFAARPGSESARQGVRIDRSQVAVGALFVVYNLALFLVLHVMSRYRVQFLPVLYVAAGVTVAGLAGRTMSRSRRAWALGAAAAALLLFLAFSGP
jgi:hypothetical protein